MNAQIKWLDSPEVFRVNQLEAHSDHLYYECYKDYQEDNRQWQQSLGGTWSFFFSQNAKMRPAKFYEEDFDCSSFTTIQVPAHIELAGYDQIRYINTMYPWEGKEYRRGAYSLAKTGNGEGMFSEAEYNPVGSYVREFDLEPSLCNKRVHLCFEGVEQAMYVWLNGRFIGYAEDSFTPSEFDLTPYLREKKNRLAVEVYKMSTAAFLEDQDFFRFFGIFREVTLKAIPDTHIKDIWIQPGLHKDNQTGVIQVRIKGTQVNNSNKKVVFIMQDQEGKSMVNATIPLKEMEGEFSGEVSIEVGQVACWENHHPYLYQTFVEVYDQEHLVEIVPYKVGFRRLEIVDKVMYLNGKRLIILGVNRHEWSPYKGRAIGQEEMTEDMECIKRNHINGVRTCHYPNQIPWYYLCDKEGIYLMSETNLESHGSFQKLGKVETSWNIPGSLPQWKKAVLDRAKTHFETFKNHTSILFWSLGNESYVGEDIEAMNQYFKEKEDGRLVHYEGAYYNRAYENTVSDVESRMYAKPWEVEEYLKNDGKKPYLLCEFMHNMGNSMGGLGSYMEILERNNSYQGGFLWDLIDQALMVKDEITGVEVLRYGGDFDDRPSDYEFCANGLLFADRTEKPAMQEVRYYYGKYI